MDEPVAFFNPHKGFYWAKPTKFIPPVPVTVDVEPLALYTQRTWVGLTAEEIHDTPGYRETSEMYRFALALESKLKEKNT